ncbi:CHAT domain-containing protein [Streptomyces hainanensis]|uniref:CHAT domain-containing protein n=1 Tax=Streptomyces hainanensis TaxID=402648 RepID=A0A4R4TFD8_9ACTN|nr:CHAT domain-containing protein [Streptomyces hainanensis]TDC73633.1 CHAT domain-containing protein [Streptomyces hainanensis]
MGDDPLAELVTRLREHHETGDPAGLLDDAAQAAVERLSAAGPNGPNGPDAVWVLIEAHRVRAEADPERHEPAFRALLELVGLRFMADPWSAPRPLWPRLTALTGFDPLADPLDRLADLVRQDEERGGAAVADLAAAVDVVRRADVPGREPYRDTVLGLALGRLAASAERAGAERLADATEAVRLLGALAEGPGPSARRWLTYAAALERRLDLAGDPADLAAAEAAHRRALDLAAEGDPARAEAQAGIGIAHARRAEAAQDAGDAGAELREAVRWLRRAADRAPGSEAHRANLARATGRLVRHTVRAALAAEPEPEPEPEHAPPSPSLAEAPSGGPPDPEARRQAAEFVELAARVGGRVVTLAAAAERLAEPARAPGPAALAGVLEFAAHQIPTRPPHDLLPALALAMAVAEPRWGTDPGGIWWWAADLYVEAARLSLTDRPDGAVFRRAREVVDRQIATLRAAPGPDAVAELGETLFAAGLLHVTPYLGRMAGLSFEGAHELWRRRETQRRAVTPGPEPDPDAMPDAEAAAGTAVRHHREAVGLTTGHPRGRALKALAEALSMLAGLGEGGPGHDREIGAAVREALDLLDPARDPLGFLYLLRCLALLGELALPDRVADLLPVRLDELPPHEAQAVRTETLQLLDEARRPDLAAQLLRLAERLPSHPTDPAQLRRMWDSAVHALPGNRLACVPMRGRLPEAAERLRSLADDQQWPAPESAAALVHLAAHCAGEADALGRELLAEARRRAPEWAAEAHLPLSYLDARLAHGLAAGAHDTDPRAATRWHARAAEADAACGQLDLALADLDAAAHCLERCPAEEAPVAAVELVPPGVLLAGRLDEPAALRFRDLWQRVLLAVSGEFASPAVALTLHQVAKALDLTAVLAAAGPLDPSPRLAALLDRQRAEVPADVPPPAAELPGPVSGRLYYVGLGEAEPGGDREAESRNQQRAADRRISARLHATRGRAALPALPDEIQARIDADTVLVSLFLGHQRGAADGRPRMAVQAVALTREDLWHGSVRHENLDGGLLRLTRGTRRLALSPLAFQVGEVRREVVTDPLFRAVGRRGARLLADGATELLTPLAGLLPEWRAAGKRHLCVWPNGPLHYFPYHLLSPDGRPLADDWTVTQLPSLGALAPPDAGDDRPTGRGLVAFAAEHGPEEVGLADQARRIAAPFGGTVVAGAAATPRRFLAELPGARYLHVAAHGRHNEWAPWYQCLQLSPDADGEGRVFAHDVLRADLRGVALVTLSSCDSALGRFDINDNLRGLPAAFLAAGASAVVGCLWPVHPDVATHFFATLYARLDIAPDRRAAYRAAQLATRERFPAYRDWGAFCFVGDWRTP